MKPYIGRFAPSPTGPLHFGSLLAALASYLDARHHGGQWLVRIEDIDITRCRPEWTTSILTTLEQFGFAWDGEVVNQTRRLDHYHSALATLRHSGRIYARTCSRREVADSAMAGIDGPVYPGTCRQAGHPEAGAALRVLTDDRETTFIDAVQGRITQRLQSQVGDFILRRRDGLFAYQLVVVVDDALQGVTHIVRGADLLDSTSRQIHLIQALGGPQPQYLHIPVASNAAGQKLSKQTLAGPVNVGEAVGLLNAALAFLGQPAVTADHPQHLLDVAAGQWDQSLIPATRSRTPTHILSA